MDYIVLNNERKVCVDFNRIMENRFRELGWEAIRTGDVWRFKANGSERRFKLLFPPHHYYSYVSIEVSVDISDMWGKELLLEISNPIGGCEDLIRFGDYVEAKCKGISVRDLPYNHLDDEYDNKYLSPLHKDLSKFVRKVIQEGKNRVWNEADPYGRMQPRIGWPGSTVPWFATNPDGTVMTDEYGGLVSNGTMESLIRGTKG